MLNIKQFFMRVHQVSLFNSIILIAFGIWGYFDTESLTALIPTFFGCSLLVCYPGIKNENKIIAHIAVLLTLVILVALIVMRLPKSIDTGGEGLIRVIIMIITCSLAMFSFIKSFIKTRKNK
tara:strand:+ start:1254 stop:1619 length:366 start_codon:yes stop_codon:yes gene_type:complete